MLNLDHTFGIQQLKMVPRQQRCAEALCIFSTCIFWNYVRIFCSIVSLTHLIPCLVQSVCSSFLCSNISLKLNLFFIYDAVPPASVAASHSLQLSLIRGSSRLQIYRLLTSLLLPPSLSLPSLLLVCPPSLVLKIDSSSISVSLAPSLAECIDGERKNTHRERNEGDERKTAGRTKHKNKG